MDRRKFIHDLSHAAALPSLFSSFSLDNFIFGSSSSISNTISKGNILIIINMNGGNDGLNTVIPLNQYSELNKVRPHVIMPESKLVQLGSNDLALHPALNDLKYLYDEERFKIIQNVGYPNSNFSHFRSMDIWLSGSGNEKFLYSGWLARFLEKNHKTFPNNYPNIRFPDPLAIEVSSQTSLLLTGEKSTMSFVTNNPSDFFSELDKSSYEYDESIKGSKLLFLQTISNQSQDYGSRVKEAYEQGTFTSEYPRSHLGSQFEKMTKLITGGLNTRIYYLNYGGFDTHGLQVDTSDRTKGQHASLLKELNDCIVALFKNLDKSGDSERILGMTISEFGRTIKSNATNGTDHGSIAPVFIFGNKINSAVLGSNPVIPEINPRDWNQKELELQFDYRSIFSSVLDQWMGESKSSNEIFYGDFKSIDIIKKQYIDTDNDGVMDINDNCPDTPEGSVVDLNGCVLFTLAANNYSVKSVSASCIGSNNGKIEISAEDTSYTYQVNISGIDSTYSLSADNNHSLVIEDLEVGAYTINFTIDSQEGYIQSFETTITEPAPLQGKAQVDYFSKTATLKLSGSEVYYIEVNGQMMASNSNDFSAPLKPGKNIIKVTTPLDCQGVYEEVLFMSEKLRYFPNPVQNELNITVPGTDSEINIEIFTDGGANLYRGTHSINGSRTIQLPMSRYKSGLYIVTGSGKTVNESFKIIKN